MKHRLHLLANLVEGVSFHDKLYPPGIFKALVVNDGTRDWTLEVPPDEYITPWTISSAYRQKVGVTWKLQGSYLDGGILYMNVELSGSPRLLRCDFSKQPKKNINLAAAHALADQYESVAGAMTEIRGYYTMGYKINREVFCWKCVYKKFPEVAGHYVDSFLRTEGYDVESLTPARSNDPIMRMTCVECGKRLGTV